LTDSQKAETRHRAAAGEKKTDLVLAYGVSRETVYNVLR
jgi:hypothetical protein